MKKPEIKQAFIPIPYEGFCQSFMANVKELESKYKRGLNEGYEFFGIITGHEFLLRYQEPYARGSDCVIEGTVERCDGGIYLTYRCEKFSYQVKANICLTFIPILLLLIMLFCMERPYISAIGLIICLVIVSIGLHSLLSKEPKDKDKLLRKLNEICCGYLGDG